jgi:hypothetical protein
MSVTRHQDQLRVKPLSLLKSFLGGDIAAMMGTEMVPEMLVILTD